ncbi:hypothetical protein GCM10010185_19180 [Saccharothrix coeruleofusca]|uniref:Uncharacterized protein n=1 Tax=Saccharothrix coeruleofusca TaxID=33919 RepID=A0A918AJR6_9PSEU|nr:hypothetical protein GCM10010185_19180 [Saccharothrix coeruleofusca]
MVTAVVVVVVVVVDEDDEVTGSQEVGGLLGGCDAGGVSAGWAVVVVVAAACVPRAVFSAGWGCSAGLRTGGAAERPTVTDPDTVTTTVDVRPPGPTTSRVLVCGTTTTSPSGWGGFAHGLVTSSAVSTTPAVATTAPPAVSSTAEDSFLVGDSG